MSGEDNASMAHSSGLGVMPSMSAECTPLKHRYDACFNKWFEEYLGLPASASSSSSASTSASKSDAEASNRDSGVSGLFSRTKSSVTPSQSPDERKRLRERLDGDCGPFWKEYQSCVLRAVKSKDLDGLIEEARISNPFPFPHDRKPDSRPNNEPFPFPSAASTTDTR